MLRPSKQLYLKSDPWRRESKDRAPGAAGTCSDIPLHSFNCARNNKTTSIFNGTATRVQMQGWNNQGKLYPGFVVLSRLTPQ